MVRYRMDYMVILIVIGLLVLGSCLPVSASAESLPDLADIMGNETCKTFFVDGEQGNDLNNGSQGAPFRTIERAQKEVRKTASFTLKDIYVLIKGGEYNLSQTLTFETPDFNAKRKVVYMGYDGRPVISGGRKVTGWTLHDNEKNIYQASVPAGTKSRQFFVNGLRGVRARSDKGLANATHTETGHTTTDTFLADFQKPSDLEMIYYQNWTQPRCGVSSITVHQGVAEVIMDQPGFYNVSNKGITSATVPAYYENAYELLDSEGEWYLDSDGGVLYYKPRFFEDITTADAVLPVMEKLMVLSGVDDLPVKNIEFRNISFRYATWNRPGTNSGHSDAQNNHIRDNGEPDRLVDGVIEINEARNIRFYGCEFSKLGTTAIKLTNGIQGCEIVGNVFRDISASAVTLGEPLDHPSVYKPALDKDKIRNNKIENNYVHTAGVEYRSAAAFSAGFPMDTSLSSNEIYNVPYSGFHVGYGWDNYKDTLTAIENVKIESNYIHNILNTPIYDGGGIYIIGASNGTMENPNLVKGNYVKDVYNHFGPLYADNGTMFWKFTQNVVDVSKSPTWYGNGGSLVGESRWLLAGYNSRNNQFVNNYATRPEYVMRSTDSIFEDAIVYSPENKPQPVLDIINAAGIKPEFLAGISEGLKEITIQTAYNGRIGVPFDLAVSGVTGKDEPYSLEGKIQVQNKTPEFVNVNGLTVTPVAAGRAILTAAIIDNEVLNEFTVVIEVN